MTAQTQSQRNASYRQRQREKIARMEGALREIENEEMCSVRNRADQVVADMAAIARKALS